MRWDIFCKVIDNHGDAGVCWRLARELGERGHSVRLWIDTPGMLAWMAPGGHPAVQVVPWTQPPPMERPGDVVVEAFGCDPPPAFVVAMAAQANTPEGPPVWINLEYLSAEPYVERNHGLPSPVASGPGAGLTKHFHYPGFTARTGGLLREHDLPARRSAWDRDAWLRKHGVASGGGRIMSLFCYEPPALPGLLAQLAEGADVTQLLVTAGRAGEATRAAVQRLSAANPQWNAAGRLRLRWLPLLTQQGYDELLWSCDLNFVRGEDSVVRALLAGNPFVWQIYPQDDDAHLAKLEAFLDWLAPPAGWMQFHHAWNARSALELPPLDIAGWAAAASEASARAWSVPELATSLADAAAARARI